MKRLTTGGYQIVQTGDKYLWSASEGLGFLSDQGVSDNQQDAKKAAEAAYDRLFNQFLEYENETGLD